MKTLRALKTKEVSGWYKWELITLLWFAFFFNQGDRQIFNVVIPLIKPDLGLSDVQLGLVATIFTLLYGLLVPVAGYTGDILPKNRIVFASLLIFSAGTLLTGLSTGIVMLIIFRSIATGAGEAFYYPAANSLIGVYHRKTRAQAMSIHQTANYIGIVMSGLIGGYIGENYGWRQAFYVFGSLGIVLAAVVFIRLKNEKQHMAQPVKTTNIPVKQVIRHIFQKPTLTLLSLAFGGMVFVHIGYLTWIPTFLHEKFDLSLTNSGFSSVFYHHLLAFAGVILGGRLSDKLSVKRKKIRMEIEFLGLLLGAPFIWWMGQTGSLTLAYVALAGFGFFRGMYDSNLFAAPFDVIEPEYRSSATGVMLSFAFVIGALAPVVLGWMKQGIGLSYGIASLSGVYVVSAILVFIATRFFFEKDFISE